MQTEDNSAPESTLAQLARAREEAKHTAKTGEGGSADGQAEDLPQGTTKVARSSSDEGDSGGEAANAVAEAAEQEEETLIRIGDQTFKSQADAIRYAERLESEKLASDAYNQGVREAMRANAPAAEPEPEDNFDERFYSDPKGTLKEVKDKAVNDALAIFRQEQQREVLWGQFLTAHPDIERKDAERILNDNWETIGKMTDLTKAQSVLAQRTRAEYQRMADRLKPRSELPAKGGQAVSPSGGSAKGVTPEKKDEKPLDFISQMKKLNR